MILIFLIGSASTGMRNTTDLCIIMDPNLKELSLWKNSVTFADDETIFFLALSSQMHVGIQITAICSLRFFTSEMCFKIWPNSSSFQRSIQLKTVVEQSGLVYLSV